MKKRAKNVLKAVGLEKCQKSKISCSRSYSAIERRKKLMFMVFSTGKEKGNSFGV